MNYTEEAKQNFNDLSKNPYPGRGIVLGTSADGKSYVQVYWIMGRSVNSRNRVFEIEADTGFMKTKAFDESKLTDPIYNAIKLGGTFESALRTRQYEDDAPNFTPRISGIHYKNAEPAIYKLSILKSRNNSEDAGCERMTFEFEKALPGLGHFISTYETDGKPIPSFNGFPKLMPIFNTAEETLKAYWDALNADNKVSLMVKWIDRETFEAKTIIVNKNV